MASEDALIGNDFTVQVGDGNSPEVFTNLCASFSFGSIGEDKPLVDVTTYCDLARAYRNGLADGVEIPLQCIYVPGDTQIRALYNDYKADAMRNFRIAVKDSSPAEYFGFGATVRAWNIVGEIGEKAALTFTLKVSGSVSWVVGP